MIVINAFLKRFILETFKYRSALIPAMPKDISKDEQVGFHKGSLTTLAKEREEMLKILSIVEQLMQMHIKSLQELGVDLQKEAQQAKTKKPIEDALR